MKHSKISNTCITTLVFLSVLLILVAVIVLPIKYDLSNAHADSIEIEYKNVRVEKENLEKFYNSMNILESELESYNTSVLEQLNKQLTRYKNMLNNGTYSDLNGIKSLISTTENLIKEYNEYYNRNITRAPYHALYTPIIAAAIAYFNSKDYILSAELLTHAKENDVLNSAYKIQYTNVIESSNLFKEVANSTSMSGEIEFVRTGNLIDDDLFFSIHNCTYNKNMPNSRSIILTDTYDFIEEEYGDGIINTAISQMYAAQQAGALIPYTISEHLTDIGYVQINNTNPTYIEYTDLYQAESRIIIFSVNGFNKMNVTVENSSQELRLVANCLQWDSDKSNFAKNINCNFEFKTYEYIPTTIIIGIENTAKTQPNSIKIKITCS